MKRHPIAPLFPIPFYHGKRVVPENEIRILIDILTSARRSANSANTLLSHTLPLDEHFDESLGNVKSALLREISVLGYQMFGETLEWQIKEMWGNILEPGGEQAMHAHANSFISGVLYLNAPHPSANLVFHRPQSGTEFVFSNFHKNSELTRYNAPRQQIGPIDAGDLVLFPSYLLHSVPKNDGPTRLSVAFNAIPTSLETWGYKVTFGHD